MKKLLTIAVAVALLGLVSADASAQGKFVLSVGGDVLLPMGTFGDAQSTGFGGSVRGQYNFTPMFSAGLTVGYYIWSGKDQTVGGITIKGGTFKGLPVRAFGKYYFMPETEKVRFYGIAELGMFFGTVDVPATTINTPLGPITVGGGSASSTDFNYAPGLGVEFGLGSGNTKLDVSARYDGIATSGGSSGSIGARVGVNFGLGN
jgi:outer membrane protein W